MKSTIQVQVPQTLVTMRDIYSAVDVIDSVPVDGGSVIYSDAKAQVIYLNHTAAAILELCNGAANLQQISRAIMDACDLSAPPDDDVKSCVSDLLLNDLIVKTNE